MSTESEIEPRLDYRAKVHAYFRSGELEQITANLVRYAESQLRTRIWMGIYGGPTPSGIEAIDIVRDVVIGVLQDEGTIGPVKDMGVEAWLRWKIRSVVSNLVRGYENRNRDRFREADAEECDELDQYESGGDRNDAELIELETKLDPLLMEFFTFIKDDAEVTAMVEFFMDGITKRDDVAKKLGVSPAAVTNATKRLERKQKDFAKLNSEKNPFIK